MPVTDKSNLTQNFVTKTESIAHIINKFETINKSLNEKDTEHPPRPTTAPPALPPNSRSVVERKDELISKLCEEVCYLNTQIIELKHYPTTHSEPPLKYVHEKEKRKPGLFDGNYFIISGSVSPTDEVAANISSLSEKKHLADSKQLLSDSKHVLSDSKHILSGVPNGSSSPVRSMVTHYNQDQLAEYEANELNTSPKVSNLSGSSHFNVPETEHKSSNSWCEPWSDIEDEPITTQYIGHVIPLDQSENALTPWIKQSVTSLESNVSPPCSIPSIQNAESSDSLDLDSESFNFSSESSTPQNSRGLQRFNGFENLEDLLKNEKFEGRVSNSPDLRECVAKCDWTEGRSPGNRTMHSLTFDEMTEWNLSNSDLAGTSRVVSDSDSEEEEEEGPQDYSHTNGQEEALHFLRRDILLQDQALNGEQDTFTNEDDVPTLRQALQKTQAQCDKTMKEFNKMRTYLDTVTDQVYSVPLLATSHLACSQELLDNDSVQSSRRHSVAESPWGNFNNFVEGRNMFGKTLNQEYPQNGRLKKAKSGIRPHTDENVKISWAGQSLSIRELVREVCAEEALSETAKLRQQLKERDVEIEHLHAENDDLCDSIRHLESRIDEKCEQQAKLQSLNRSLQAQNFTLSTNLSHKDLSVEKLKKYLNKGPPSRTSSSSPLSSIPEVLPNTAYKYGFLNRSSQSISRRKSLRPWKRRLCVLDHNHLSVYKVENAETFITVGSILDVKCDEQRSFGKNVIMLVCDDGREHFLQANSKEDMLEWITRIGSLLNTE